MDARQMLEQIDREAEAAKGAMFFVFAPRVARNAEGRLEGFGRIRDVSLNHRRVEITMDDGTVVYAHAFRYLRPIGENRAYVGVPIKYACDDQSYLVQPVEVLDAAPVEAHR